MTPKKRNSLNIGKKGQNGNEMTIVNKETICTLLKGET